MKPKIPVEVPQRHLVSELLTDWMAIRAGGTVVLVHEPSDTGTNTYTLGKPTTNPRVMVQSDAILWEGGVVRAFYDDEVVLSHSDAGHVDWLPVDEMLDEPAPTLERTELVQLKGVGGTVEFHCIDCGEHVKRDQHQMDIPGMTPSRCASCTFDRMAEP